MKKKLENLLRKYSQLKSEIDEKQKELTRLKILIEQAMAELKLDYFDTDFAKVTRQKRISAKVKPGKESEALQKFGKFLEISLKNPSKHLDVIDSSLFDIKESKFVTIKLKKK